MEAQGSVTLWRTIAGAAIGVAGTMCVGWVMLSGRYVVRDELHEMDRNESAEIKATLDIIKNIQIEQARMAAKLDYISERLGRR